MTTPPCPACTAVGLTRHEDGSYHCRYCRSSFPGDAVLCPSCGWLNSEQDDVCSACKQPLTIVGNVMGRSGPEKANWLERTRSQAQALKLREERASKQRMQTFMAQDQRRMERARREEAQRKQTERQWLLYVFGATAVMIAALIIAMLVLRG